MKLLFLAIVLSLSFNLKAEPQILDLAPLDAPYASPQGIVETEFLTVLKWDLRRAVEKNDMAAMLEFQTPVKSQQSRGVCSLFSATAMVESLMKIHYKEEVDFSESYLSHLIYAKIQTFPRTGSDTPDDIKAYSKYGAILEATWPYEGEEWTDNDLSESESKKRDKMCGELKGDKKKACLLSHLNPEKDPFQKEAKEISTKYELSQLQVAVLRSSEEIKKHLNNNNALVLGVDFFYKAWNHRKMVDYGLGSRDMNAWNKGIVGKPTREDIRASKKHPAGHSILIVGYDDAKRVYYFKNSWGTGSFGVDNSLVEGKSTAGYGEIPYDYANQWGTMYLVSYE